MNADPIPDPSPDTDPNPNSDPHPGPGSDPNSRCGALQADVEALKRENAASTRALEEQHDAHAGVASALREHVEESMARTAAISGRLDELSNVVDEQEASAGTELGKVKQAIQAVANLEMLTEKK